MEEDTVGESRVWKVDAEGIEDEMKRFLQKRVLGMTTTVMAPYTVLP